MLDAFEFNDSDRMPAFYHPSPAGLYTHGRKLLDLFNRYPPDNAITFDSMPHPPKGTVDPNGDYHELSTDEWGTTWEYLIFGVTGHPKKYPFADWQAAADYQFPPLPNVAAPGFAEKKKQIEQQNRDFLVWEGCVSLFERLHALRPIDDVLVDLFTGDEHLMAFLDRLADYWLQAIDYYLELGTDVIQFGDDWGTQTGQMVSTELFRDLFKPHYKRLFDRIRQSDVRIFFHSCGDLGGIFDELLDLGIDGFWPQITLYDEQTFPDKCKAHKVTIHIHPDRQQLVPRATPAEIDARIRNYARRYHHLGGGGIFYVEIENDAPFENVKTLIEAVDRYR